MKFSANLGFLFREHSLLDAVRVAGKAGFTAIEAHWPYDTPASDLRAALVDAGLPLLGINTGVGDRARGDFGLSAVPGREAEARAFIDQAIDYAAAAGGNAVHIMAGKAEGENARATFLDNLRYAASRIGDRDIAILIEPLNHRDAPGYFLRTLEQAITIIEAARIPCLKLMFDCYHTQIEGGDLLSRFTAHLAHIGHVQIASVPERAEPDTGEVAYDRLLPAMVAAGYAGWIGAEYKPRTATAEGLGWLSCFGADR
ncbi:MAG TPA: TIM barrel protein [Devosia sp.]|nr:TIM barrel protein [Devosia sp.]